MKNAKRIWTLCFALLLGFTLLVVSAGCSSEQGGTDDTQSPEPESTEEPSTVEITIIYSNRDGEVARVTEVGSATLTIDEAFSRRGTITVQLSDNQKFMWFNFDDNLENALIYCENSTFTYTFDNYTGTYFPPSVAIGNGQQNQNPTIKVWIPTNAELNESRNIALNPYDQTKAEGTYPHASSNSIHDSNTGEWAARNAIDGFKQGSAHGTYPYQSWGPEYDNKDMYWQVDFGKEVTVSGIGIAVRSDFDHDTPFNSVTIVFSDGSEQTVSLEKTAEVQNITFDGEKTTSSIQIKNFEKAFAAWSGFMEVEVYGVYGNG